ncbi:MAG: relaxase/mobilization nuclease domain-containing protein [Lachnospiraceae bacterium]|nr:relaxase/mobilization nuclease domain-containing protein [Lachnospiraceae bacterium]
MAISKILYIGDCGSGYSGKHLKQALDYIVEKHKTGNGRWMSSINCQPENVYEQMKETKVQFGKTDQRQGYHMIISFVEGEVDAETAFEVIGRFTKEYLGQDYEALYAVHDNTEHIHGHIIFNSVSFRTGKKYRYEKGDWAKKIQPITNRLCEEYGLSTIEISEDRAKPSENYKEWNDFRDGKFVWADMIKRDIDACIMQAATYESFLSMLSDMGYGIKNAYRSEGKHLAIKPMGLTRFRRCKSLGENYTEERIRERIETENLSTYRKLPKEQEAGIVWCRIKRYKRAKLSGVQKKYFARLYRTGLLKKRPYSQAWKYRDDIRKMQKLQEEYLFLVRHEVQTAAGVAAVAESMTDKKKDTSREKSRIFKERARMKPLFDIAAELMELQEMENCYRNGEKLFEKEHKRYAELLEKLEKEGYTVEQTEQLKEHYKNEIAKVRDKEKAVAKEERIAGRILRDLLSADTGKEQTREKEENRKVEKDRQPHL